MDSTVPADHKEDRQILESCYRAVENEGDSDTNCSWHTRNSSQMLGEKTGGTGDQRRDQD